MTKTEIEHILSIQRGQLLNLAKRFMKSSGSAEDADDIVQEALTELWMLFESGYRIRNTEALAGSAEAIKYTDSKDKNVIIVELKN